MTGPENSDSRAATDLEVACAASVRGGSSKTPASFVLRAESPKRPPGGGRSLPGWRRAEHLHSKCSEKPETTSEEAI